MVPVAAVCMGCAHDNINPHKSLPRGERRYSHEKINEDLQLQSTLPHGKRPFWDEQYREETQASIHAPARGATAFWRDAQTSNPRFNPRSRTGSDCKWA